MVCDLYRKEENAMSITLIPYLGFNGTCKEAVDKYIHAFGGQI